MTDLKKPILWLVALIVLLAGWSFLAQNFVAPTQKSVAPTSAPMSNVAYVPPQPTPTAADTVAAESSRAFQYLVSYTDSGFEPATLHVKAGDAVRFTNNSHEQLWVAADGSELYPAVQNGCGSSALDSCGPIQPGAYWQFTFTQKGTWSFTNNLQKSKTGTVTVQVQ